MGVYIKGVSMPKSCKSCEFRTGDSWGNWCEVTKNEIVDETMQDEKRNTDCPLLPVPNQHGNLIDKLALCHELKDKWKAGSLNAFSLMNDIYICFARIVLAAPVIIPEEEDE